MAPPLFLATHVPYRGCLACSAGIEVESRSGAELSAASSGSTATVRCSVCA
jgi:hypothetical protein